jgi:S1-C subfamily serine protease
MASFDPVDSFGPHEPPPRPTTPPVRLGFLIVLAGLLLAAALVYGIPYIMFRAGYAYESGRARAAEQSLARLDKAGIVNEASALFRAASTAVSPAVVNIQCWKEMEMAHAGVDVPPGVPRKGPVRFSAGSGVVIDKKRGFIVTNGHVVEGADEIRVRVGRGVDYPASLVGADGKTDLAVLKIDAPLEVEARWGDVGKVDVGDWVLAIGSPFELERSVTVGIISAIGRRDLPNMAEGSYQDFIQTDAAINPGNSGGPLIDLRGQIIGINTAIYSPRDPESPVTNGGNVGIGFAISAELAKGVVEQIIQNGRVVRGYLGVLLSDLQPADVARKGLPEGGPGGALIVRVDPGSPAAKGGLQPGDVVVGIDAQPVSDLTDLRNRTATLPIGSEVPITYFRDGKQGSSTIRISELPTLRALGLWLREESTEGPGPTTRLVIDQVLPFTPAHRAGLREGMTVLGVANRPVSTIEAADSIADRLDPNEGVLIRLLLPGGREGEVLLGTRPPRR